MPTQPAVAIGGCKMYRNVDVDESEDEAVSRRCCVYFIHIDATVNYLQLYDALATDVTVGTTTADLTFALPTQGDANGAGFVLQVPSGIQFNKGLTVAATTTAGGSAGPGANEVILSLGYMD